jgi:N-formylglutamate deformylase
MILFKGAPMPYPAFDLFLPKVTSSCVVFASPHSGRDYAADFLAGTLLDDHMIRSSEDAFVDRLYETVPDQGAPLLCARAPRAYVDLNRAHDELDPALIEGVRRGGHNPRVASGLGVIPRVVAHGRAIYRGKMPRAEAESRLDQVWQPYHHRLETLLDQAHRQFGQAILVDCHSMPREAVESALKPGGLRPEIVLGDRFGASAARHIVDGIEQAFSAAGFHVARNAPFAGAYTTQHYGRPSKNQHAIQIEIDRSIYMDESAIRPHSGFEDIQQRLRQVIARITDLGRPADQPLAAE